MDYWEFTQKKYPDLAAKGYCFRTNIDRDATKGERRQTKKWCRKYLDKICYGEIVFAIEWGIIRDDLPAYSPQGDGRMGHLCPVFGKMRLIPAK
jgi:hypothetical protein